MIVQIETGLSDGRRIEPVHLDRTIRFFRLSAASEDYGAAFSSTSSLSPLPYLSLKQRKCVRDLDRSGWSKG